MIEEELKQAEVDDAKPTEFTVKGNQTNQFVFLVLSLTFLLPVQTVKPFLFHKIYNHFSRSESYSCILIVLISISIPPTPADTFARCGPTKHAT